MSVLDDVFATLFGDPSAPHERDRNVPWNHFTGRTGATEHTATASNRFERAVIADPHAAAARFPTDKTIISLVRDLHATSDHFAQLSAAHEVGAHVRDAKTLHHAAGRRDHA